jgi:serine/threonine-protein kinase/endoribonuclease IRE1
MPRYFALELCDASLDKLFLKSDELEKYKGPRLQDMPPPQVVFSQLAEGMAYIHEMGMTHRDVKPLNVLFYVKYRLEKIHQVIFKWADFGTSKRVNITGQCLMSSFKFTSSWCAPEVIKIYAGQSSQSAGIQSDVFSEGLVFSYYLLKGEHPYGNEINVLHNLSKNTPEKLDGNVPI